jgi:PhnB protein
MPNTLPEGYSTVTPSLCFKDCAKAIETYKKAFGAKELYRMEMPDGSGKIMHAVIEIGNSKIMMGDDFGNWVKGGGFYVYMPNCDAAMKQAKDAGLKETMPAEDMFWGDRLGAVSDEYGIQWTIAEHQREVSAEDLDKGAKEMAQKMKSGAGQKAA